MGTYTPPYMHWIHLMAIIVNQSTLLMFYNICLYEYQCSTSHYIFKNGNFNGALKVGINFTIYSSMKKMKKISNEI